MLKDHLVQWSGGGKTLLVARRVDDHYGNEEECI